MKHMGSVTRVRPAVIDKSFSFGVGRGGVLALLLGLTGKCDKTS
jgi:hypothetical protein